MGEDKVTEHKNIHTALATAQGEMGPLIKGAENPHFKKSYADLSSVVSASREALVNNGISWHYEIRRHEAGLDMVTIFTHGATDTFIECAVPLIVQKQDMQGMKSATTYAKRIGHESLSGLAPEDDDGNDAVKAKPKTITADQFQQLKSKADEAGVEVSQICERAGVTLLEMVPAEMFDGAMRVLQKTIDAKPQPEMPAPDDDINADEITY